MADFNKISERSLERRCATEDFTRIFTRSSQKGAVQDHARTSWRGVRQDLPGLLTRCTRSGKDLLDDVSKISERFFRKRCARGDFTWIFTRIPGRCCARSCKDLLGNFFNISTKSSHKDNRLRSKCKGADGSRDRDPHVVRACAAKMHVDISPGPEVSRVFCKACAIKMHSDLDISEEPFYARIYKENAGEQTDPKTAIHMSREPAQSNALGHLRRAISCKNSQQKKVAPQKLGAGFVRACAVDMHTDMSEKPFYARI